MKLDFDVVGKNQPDPFIFEDDGKYYIYVTAGSGVEAYSSNDIFGKWNFCGVVTQFEKGHNFWAPSVIKYEGKYYMYVSFQTDEFFQHMHVACASSPLGPFTNEKRLYDEFSIDSHIVRTSAGLFLWYAKDCTDGERIGTQVFVDKMIDPYTPNNQPKKVVVPTFDEEIYQKNRYGDGRNWHTVEGPFWFRDGEWQYIMYSGGCFENDTYHVGFATARSNEEDLLKVDFEKHTDKGAFSPVLIKNSFEEGTGHHSVIKYKGEYYAIYHGRDYCKKASDEYIEARNARICKLFVKDGIITAERFEERI